MNTYLRSGNRAQELQRGGAKLEVPIQVAARRAEGEKRKGGPEENADPQAVFEGFGAPEAGGGIKLSKEQQGLLEKCARARTVARAVASAVARAVARARGGQPPP